MEHGELMTWAHAGPSVAAAFLASLVEFIEALTVVLAVGVVRGWRPALLGTGLGLGVLFLIVILLGPALARIPIDIVQLVVGTLLLLFGLRWLRKAILRAAGIIPLHDEEAAFRAETAHLRHGAGAIAALLVVVFLGVILHRPLAKIPENALKFAVGVLLCAFGAFWVGEGIGVVWPAADWSILSLIAGFLAVALLSVPLCRGGAQLLPTEP